MPIGPVNISSFLVAVSAPLGRTSCQGPDILPQVKKCYVGLHGMEELAVYDSLSASSPCHGEANVSWAIRRFKSVPLRSTLAQTNRRWPRNTHAVDLENSLHGGQARA